MIVESHLTLDGQVLVVDLTWMVTVLPAWTRPSAIVCQATMNTPVAETRRWTVTGSVDRMLSVRGPRGNGRPEICGQLRRNGICGLNAIVSVTFPGLS
jgi:hypothetical protein